MEMDAYSDEVGPTAGRPLNLRQIEVFRAIMMSGSISGAGRMLHVSQPAVSRVLALTESRLGYRLFDRVKSRLSPTAEARRLYAEVEQVYGGIQRVNDLAASLAQSGAGMLKIVASASFGQRLIPRALERLRSRNLFHAVRWDGRADRIRTRVTRRQSPPRRPLADVAAEQIETDSVAIEGSLVGFWMPRIYQGITVAGLHLHFISADRTVGGHVRGAELGPGVLHMTAFADFHLRVPTDDRFLAAELSHDDDHRIDAVENGE